VFQREHSLFSMKQRVVSMDDAMVRSPEDVVHDEAVVFPLPLRVFPMNEAKVSMDLAVSRMNQSKLQTRKEKSLSNQPLFQTKKDVCLRDQAVLSPISFAFQP
jgi:hypothetical protein